MEYRPGQRWICDADLALGLGIVLASDERTVTVAFHAAGVTRSFAAANAPLTRVMFGCGDSVPDHDGTLFTVESVAELEGLLSYRVRDSVGRHHSIPETALANSIRLNRPLDRLLSGSVDSDKWFRLRYLTRKYLARLGRSDLYGLVGTRTSLIPHQIYIAHEVARRYAPRVMLADEVGLGKTIEAGLILHHQLITERAGRVLIVVPESLLHQWLIEMMRRFNLNFTILDEARCEEISGNEAADNPFLGSQLILCTMEFLIRNQGRLVQASESQFDLLVVDEAHHLHWTPVSASREYEAVERLALNCRGLLLLTATPEQFGRESHFARLRLLDPLRFSDFGVFSGEQKNYQQVADVVDALLENRPLDEAGQQTLAELLKGCDANTLSGEYRQTSPSASARETLIEDLVDRHGTGRVLFRNTRASVSGFPPRRVHVYELPTPVPYLECLALAGANGYADCQGLLSPELVYRGTTGKAPDWTRIDPRVEWLAGLLKQDRKEKMLVITSSPETALDLSHCLVMKHGITAADFHERMSLVERDRAAAYFADAESGGQVLVCSEIGSEGRNFQFARHLVLFDLPFNPDLLEQRIGRLDRIGQKSTIHLHLPLLMNSAQQWMYRWYQEGLDAFEHTCPAGYTVFESLRPDLERLLSAASEADFEPELIISKTLMLRCELNAALQKGRDRLLEYNSCRPVIADDLRQRTMELETDESLPAYLELVFDCYGVDSEELGAGGLRLQPTYRMLYPFPGLPEEGVTVTWDRDAALAHEDWQFLSWEHPMVINAMDMATGGESGNAVVTAVRDQGLKPGALYLEVVYVLDFQVMSELSPRGYLQPECIDLVLDEQGNLFTALDHDRINRSAVPLPATVARQVIDLKEVSIRRLLLVAGRLAARQIEEVLADTHRRSREFFQHEAERLRSLRRVNPNVREEEIRYFEGCQQELDTIIAAAGPRLDAARVIIAT